MKMKSLLSGALKANTEEMEKTMLKAISHIYNIDSLSLPQDVGINPKTKKADLQTFYEELGCPFFNSLTKKQIKKLAKLQLKVWQLHMMFKRFLILKSQKIGVSSICILITLFHALTDCVGMELIITAQSDEQAKTHAQDLRRIVGGSDRYRDYLITKEYTSLGLLKDEITKVHTIYLHNPRNPRLPTKIIITGMSPGALLSHKRVGFVWSSDMTISNLTSQRQYDVWAAFLSRLANSQGPCIVECPARAPSGPVYDTFERFEKDKEEKKKIDAKNDFYVEKFTYELGIRDGFFDRTFIEAEKRRLGPLFGTFYSADFFASENNWYSEDHFDNRTDDATDLLIQMQGGNDDRLSDLTDD